MARENEYVDNKLKDRIVRENSDEEKMNRSHLRLEAIHRTVSS
jgi:hypothetical protein